MPASLNPLELGRDSNSDLSATARPSQLPLRDVFLFVSLALVIYSLHRTENVCRCKMIFTEFSSVDNAFAAFPTATSTSSNAKTKRKVQLMLADEDAQRLPTSEAKQLLAAIQAVLLWRDPAEGVEDRLLRAVLSQWNALTGRRLGLQARLADFLPTALIIQLDRQLIIDSF